MPTIRSTGCRMTTLGLHRIECGLPGVGAAFVLTDKDPHFVIDVDKCRDPVTGDYDERVKRIAGFFPGAMIEVSTSGTGIHIWGVCEDGLAETYMNRVKDEYEFYYGKRFMCLGSEWRKGNPDIDWTPTLRTFLTPRENATVTSLPETGPGT